MLIGGNATQTGGDGVTLVGDTARTWYDGISYSRVEPFHLENLHVAPDNSSVTLAWNSPPPQSSLTTPSYTVQKKNSLTDSNWMTLTNGMPSAGYITTYSDNLTNGDAAFYRVIWP